MGRQKIEIKKIENEDALQVCFSKRRAGLFKKASEISTLCGADVAMVVFSPAGRPYSLGLPDIDTVVNRFLLCNPTPAAENTPVRSARQRNVIASQLNKQLMELRSLLDQQRGRRMPLETKVRMSAQKVGMDDAGPGLEGLGLEQLLRLEREMMKLRFRVTLRLDELVNGDQQEQPSQLQQLRQLPSHLMMPPPPAAAAQSFPMMPLSFLPEGSYLPVNYMNPNGLVDHQIRYFDPHSGSFGGNGSMGGGNDTRPRAMSQAPFLYSDPFPDLFSDNIATGQGRDGNYGAFSNGQLR